MIDIIKITLVLIIIIILLKRKWNLGAVMALSSVMLAFLYLLAPLEYIKAFYAAMTDKTTISLIVALILIRVFENVMRKNGIMQRMMDSFRGMVMDRRILMASMPALIGLLPSMGGALFSAPMVDEASKNINISQDKKAFVNYMFRHPWEFVLPLYPGVILASAITSYSLRDLILANLPYALCLLIGGAVWGLSGIGTQKEGLKKISGAGLISFLPLTIILIMVIVFHLSLSMSIGAVIAGLYLVLRYSPKNIFYSLKEGFSWDIVLIILGVMTFKAVLNSSGAVTNISAFFSENGIPAMPVLFFLPFIYGLLTGLTVGFVGSTFPIILGLENVNHIGAISFAFASGYVGVLLSPVHLCLVLTREYFKAAVNGVYEKIIKVSILIMAVAVVEYIILSRYGH
jgi:integral membrane protein (TIGR00529 family)